MSLNFHGINFVSAAVFKNLISRNKGRGGSVAWGPMVVLILENFIQSAANLVLKHVDKKIICFLSLKSPFFTP